MRQNPFALGGVEAGVHRDIGDLVEGVHAGLAGLGLHDIENGVLFGEHQIVNAPQQGRALGHGHFRPSLLGLARGGEGGLHIGHRGLRQIGDLASGGGREHLHRGRATGDGMPEESLDEVEGKRIGGSQLRGSRHWSPSR